jgi:hypothetical protein
MPIEHVTIDVQRNSAGMPSIVNSTSVAPRRRFGRVPGLPFVCFAARIVVSW